MCRCEANDGTAPAVERWCHGGCPDAPEEEDEEEAAGPTAAEKLPGNARGAAASAEALE